MSSSPCFPPELEYEIFLTAYQNDHKQAKDLILVAKRVFDWLIPHVFCVVMFADDNQTFPIKFNEAAYKKVGHHVRHLFIDSDLRGYLHLFPNVVDLAFWADHNAISIYIPSLLQLPLTCLSTRASPKLFPVFERLTHLDLISAFDPDSDGIKTVLYLPKLTHLCVLRMVFTTGLELFLERERCPKLMVVVVWAWGKDTAAMLNEDVEEADDQRVVMVRSEPHKDWEVGARGGVDMWRFAEAIIASRNSLRKS
ncbi:hypothetical protein BDN72DRAFT_880092 [Pluteus cervinus]|uniref:Uncharacterized protein n=1 Tax=Pluteus cervinus TaxID=181527 RepID=A0ACD3ALY6_9AGAR|nr:hypothetical protein BDN72DRAFT_880092 [Pluteus cervinus]